MYEGYLIHYNHNHDKKTGRFTFSTGKDLYKSIKRDVVTGKFDPKNYKNNESINKAIKDYKIVGQMKKRDRLLEDYNSQQKEAEFEDSIRRKLIDDRNARAQKYYKEMLNGRDESKMSDNEKYDIFEKALWKAEDEDFANPNYFKSYNLVDKSKFKNISFRDTIEVGANAAIAYEKAAKKIIGDYSNKRIRTLKSNETARKYVNDIMNTILLDKGVKIYR